MTVKLDRCGSEACVHESVRIQPFSPRDILKITDGSVILIQIKSRLFQVG